MYIHPTAIIEDFTFIGENTAIWYYSHICKGARIGNNCKIGEGVYIGPNVIIGNNCKIQNHSLIYEGVIIENDVFIGPNVVTTNDLYPKANGSWELKKTLIKTGASVGANSTIICGITLEEYCMIGAGSVVTKNISANRLAYGNPAREIKVLYDNIKKYHDLILNKKEL